MNSMNPFLLLLLLRPKIYLFFFLSHGRIITRYTHIHNLTLPPFKLAAAFRFTIRQQSF